MRILVTSGGTEEPIDGVRRIANSSTGRTGAVLASSFASRGARVTLLRSERAVRPDSGASGSVEERTYRSYADLAAALESLLGSADYDAVVHAAAVADYAVASVTVDGEDFPPGGPGKIGTGREVVVSLKPTAKLLDSLREWSANPGITVVGFKLTDGADEAEAADQVAAQFERGGPDYVVHNDLGAIDGPAHGATLWAPGVVLEKTGTKEAMAEALYALLAGEKTT